METRALTSNFKFSTGAKRRGSDKANSTRMFFPPGLSWGDAAAERRPRVNKLSTSKRVSSENRRGSIVLALFVALSNFGQSPRLSDPKINWIAPAGVGTIHLAQGLTTALFCSDVCSALASTVLVPPFGRCDVHHRRRHREWLLLSTSLSDLTVDNNAALRNSGSVSLSRNSALQHREHSTQSSGTRIRYRERRPR